MDGIWYTAHYDAESAEAAKDAYNVAQALQKLMKEEGIEETAAISMKKTLAEYSQEDLEEEFSGSESFRVTGEWNITEVSGPAVMKLLEKMKVTAEKLGIKSAENFYLRCSIEYDPNTKGVDIGVMYQTGI